MSKPRNIPAGVSPLAKTPTLTPKVGPLKVGSRGQTSDEPLEDEEAPRKAGRSRGGRRPAPAVQTAVAHTVRLDPEEATEVDRFVLTLRDDARRTRLDKAEVYRELLRLARDDDTVRRKLLRRIKV